MWTGLDLAAYLDWWFARYAQALLEKCERDEAEALGEAAP